MKALKIISGVLLFIIGLGQLIKIILIYTELPFKSWAIGSEFVPIGFIVAGIAIFINGIKRTKEIPKP